MSSLAKSKQAPPNIRHARGQIKYPLQIKERQEEYLRTHNLEQTIYPGSVPSVASNSPNDMNKQGVLSSQPQTIPNLYSSVGNHHSQSSMSGMNHGSSSTLVQPPQGQIPGRNHSQAANIQAFYGGRSNANANYGIARSMGMTVATSGNAHYSAPITNNIMYASQNPFSCQVTPSPMIIPSISPMTYSQNQYTPSQYASQQVVYRGNCPTPYYNPSGTMYYPSVNMNVPRSNISNMGGSNAAASLPPKREKKIIKISDEAGRDLTQEILSTAKNDTLSSSNASSQANSNDLGQINISVAAQFAEQVAAAVKGPSKTPPLIPASQSSDAATEKDDSGMVEQFEDSVHQFDSSIVTTIIENEEIGSKTPPPLILPSQISNCVEIKLHLEKKEIDSVTNEKSTFSHNHIDKPYSSSNKVIENNVENVIPPVSTVSSSKPVFVSSSATEADITEVEKVECVDTSSVFPETEIVETVDSTESTSEMVETDVQSETDSIPVYHNKLDSVITIGQNNIDTSESVTEASSLETEEKEIEPSTTKVDENEEIILSEKKVITSAGETCSSLVNKSDINDTKQSEENQNKENGDIPVETEIKEEVATKERKSKGKKWRDINKRGETKEGGDMDAFIDKADVINQVLSVPCLSTTSTSPIREMVFTSTKISEIAALEEQRKVAEKNEENRRVSREAENSVNENEVIESCKPDSLLKYNYTEDQWSPINMEGKKKYDRAFLLNMQSEPACLQKPKNLPLVEIVKEKPILHKLPENMRIPVAQLPNRPDPFMPTFARSSRPPPGSVNRRQSQQGKEKAKKVISMPGSLNQDVKLHASENAWKASNSKKNPDEDPAEMETKELYKKVKGILNKLTPQKFHTLVEQAKHLNIDTEARLRGVMDLVFEKAVDEPNFSVPYANMCKQIAMIKVPKAEKSGSDKDKDVNFKKLLLMKCQREFESDSSDESRNAERMTQIEKAETEEMKKQLREELSEEERRLRHRSLGNIKFIGELFKLNMLTAPIMHECVQKLLRQGEDDSLECLCRLLTTIGKELEADKSKNPNQKVLSLMDNYFEKMQAIVGVRKTSSRVRFMLQDVIELRHNNWVPRRDENNPKTIDQIHREAEREAQQQQQLLQQTPFIKRPIEDRNTNRKNRNNQNYMDDGWSMHSNKNKAATIDPTKLKISKSITVDAGNVQFGHGFAKWGQGSSGGQAKASKQESDAKSTVLSSNRYSALLVDQNPSNYEPRRGSQRSAASSRESSRNGTPNLPHPPVRKTSSQTSTKERKQAVEAVKDIARPDSQKQRTQNSVQSPESVSNERDTVLRGMNLSEEEMETKTKPLIDEFLHNRDFKEATTCVVETVNLSTAAVFISTSISHVLERSSQGRRLVGQLMHQLIKKKIIPMDSYIVGLKSVLETADDCAIDVPKIWQYLGELIEPMIQDNTISLAFLKDAAQPCAASGTGGKLVSEVLHAAARNQGNIRVAELWKAAGLQWSDFLPATENASDFVERNNLEFTLHDFKAEPATETLSLDSIKTELDSLLQRKADNEEIIDWIVAHVRERVTDPKFIRALATSAVESAIEGEVSISSFNKKKLSPRVPLMQKYVDQNVELELQVIFALQVLVNRLEHPKGLLLDLFQFLFDEDVLTDEAFTLWEKNNDPAEQEGKGVAFKSVTSFMTWLKEQDDDSVDDN